MREALHPSKHQSITIDLYLLEFGRKPVIGNDLRPRARCPICRQILNDVAGKSESSTGHFSHFQNSHYCPSKASAAEPYISLTPSNPNPKRALYLKQRFYAKWEWHYSQMCKLAAALSYQEFMALIKEANRLRIWEYSNLQEWELPYTLILTKDYPVHTSTKIKGIPLRKFWLRFWYDPSVQNLEDLWIKRTEEPKLFRASYTQPKSHNQIPGLSDIVKISLVNRQNDFLDKPVPQVPAWLKTMLDVELLKLLGI